MKIFQMTEVGSAEAGAPVANPSPARKILYYLRKRSNKTASDDMIVDEVFGGNRGEAQMAISRLIQARCIRNIGG